MCAINKAFTEVFFRQCTKSVRAFRSPWMLQSPKFILQYQVLHWSIQSGISHLCKNVSKNGMDTLDDKRPSFMDIVFGVYRNWIWKFGDLKSDTPILWGSIWPSTIISNSVFFFPLGSIVFGTQIRWS